MNSYKRIAESKHKRVYTFLIKNLPSCTIEYNGSEGVDHKIIYNGNTVYVETKTCKRIVKSGSRPDAVRPVLHQEIKLGRFKFDNRKAYPYEPLSQHTWLVEHDGWYIFAVGYLILGALPAKNVPVNPSFDKHWIGWLKILGLCHPNWLDHLKKDVYEKDVYELEKLL